MVTIVAAAGLLITLPGLRTRRARSSAVVAGSAAAKAAFEAEAEPVGVRD